MRIINDLITPNRWSRPQKPMRQKKGIVIHWVNNVKSTAKENRDFFENRKYGNTGFGSAHEIIDLNGDIVICIPEDEITYNCGSKIYLPRALKKLGEYPNGTTYAIECTHINDEGLMTKETVESLTQRCVDLCEKWGLNPLEDLWLHQEIVGWKDCHRFYVNNPDKWKKFKQEVKSRIEGEKMLTIDEALKILVDNKIISSLDYWKKACSVVKYLDVLIINVANKLKG
jgi:N-acetylmuramoyl-L-alanine amidase